MIKKLRIINKDDLYLGYMEKEVALIEESLTNAINSISGVQYTHMIELNPVIQLEFQFVCLNNEEYLFRYITWHNIKIN